MVEAAESVVGIHIFNVHTINITMHKETCIIRINNSLDSIMLSMMLPEVAEVAVVRDM